MRKYILIFGYTNFTEEETSYWNNLSIELQENGFELFVMGHVKPKFECHFFCHSFIEKLDNVDFGFYRGDDFLDNTYFEKYLNREKIWYGDSTKNRLLASKFQKSSYKLLLDELNPSLVVLGNGEHANELILKDEILNRNIPLIYFERGCLPKTWHIDNIGITAGTIIASKKYDEISIDSNQSFLDYKKYYLTKKNTWWEQPVSNQNLDLRQKFGISNDTKIILFANQLDNDTSNFLYSPFFENNLEALNWFCSELGKLKLDVFLIIKKHPYFDGNDIEFQRAIELNNLKGKWVSDMSIFDCLEQCDLFCAVNSTSIYESMIYEKPVLQLGQSILSNKNIIYELKDINQTEIITQWINMGDFSDKLRKFEYFMSYMIDNELSFFSKDLSNKNYNNHILFERKIFENVDLNRKGNYPNRFIESRFRYQRLNLKRLNLKRLFDLNVLIFKEIIIRIFMKLFKFFSK